MCRNRSVLSRVLTWTLSKVSWQHLLQWDMRLSLMLGKWHKNIFNIYVCTWDFWNYFRIWFHLESVILGELRRASPLLKHVYKHRGPGPSHWPWCTSQRKNAGGWSLWWHPLKVDSPFRGSNFHQSEWCNLTICSWSQIKSSELINPSAGVEDRTF